MKMKVVALILTVLVLMMSLSGCMHNDIGIKMNADGTGSISVKVGMEKEAYEALTSMGSSSTDKEETIEYEFDGKTYVGYTEEKEFASYEEMEKFLLELTYETDASEDADDASGEVAIDDAGDSDEADTHIFKDAVIAKDGGFFANNYHFHLTINPQEDTDAYNAKDMFRVTISVEMPNAITETVGGTSEGNKVTFDIKDVTQEQEISAVSESVNSSSIVAVVAGGVLVLCIFAGVYLKISKKKTVYQDTE